MKRTSSVVRPMLLAAILMLHVAALCAGESRLMAAEKAPRKLLTPQITISEETTFITEPLRADGCVDYLAAVDAQQS